MASFETLPDEVLNAVVRECFDPADRRAICFAGPRFYEIGRIGMLSDICLSTEKRMRSVGKLLDREPALARHVVRLSVCLDGPFAHATSLISAVMAAAPGIRHLHAFGHVGTALQAAADHCHALTSIDMSAKSFFYPAEGSAWAMLQTILEGNCSTLRSIRLRGQAGWPGGAVALTAPITLAALQSVSVNDWTSPSFVDFLVADAPRLRYLDVGRTWPHFGPGVAERIIELEIFELTNRVAADLARFMRLETLECWGLSERYDYWLLDVLPSTLVDLRVHYGTLDILQRLLETFEEPAEPFLPRLARLDWRHPDGWEAEDERGEELLETAFGRLEDLCSARGIKLAIFARTRLHRVSPPSKHG